MGSNHLIQQVYVLNAETIGRAISIDISNISLSPDVNIISSIPLDVNLTGIPGSTPANTYAEVTLVPPSSLTTVASYTVPAGKSFYIQGFVAGGTANAWFKLQINGVTVMSARSTTAQQTVTPSFLTSCPVASAGQTVTIKVIHEESSNADFEGTILGVTN